jgi:hypothetical protein
MRSLDGFQRTHAMTEIDPFRFVLRCLFAPSPSSLARQALRWLRATRRTV